VHDYKAQKQQQHSHTYIHTHTYMYGFCTYTHTHIYIIHNNLVACIYNFLTNTTLNNDTLKINYIYIFIYICIYIVTLGDLHCSFYMSLFVLIEMNHTEATVIQLCSAMLPPSGRGWFYKHEIRSQWMSAVDCR